jgi:hypothetical protein
MIRHSPRICILLHSDAILQWLSSPNAKIFDNSFRVKVLAAVRLGRCIASNEDSPSKVNRPLAPASGAPWSIEDRTSAGAERKQLGA